MKSVFRVIAREFKIIWRDSRIRSVVLIAPFVYAALFVAVYSKHTVERLPIALIVEDHSSVSRTFIRMLESHQRIEIVESATSFADLKSILYRGDVFAGVVIPNDFTLALKRGKDTRVSVFVNATNMVTANLVAKALNEVTQTFSAGVEIKTLMKKGERRESAMARFMPVKLDLHPLFNPAFSYANFLVPGLLMAVLQQVILLGLALSWTGEKEFGTLPELFGISKNPFVLFLGKALPYVLINILVAEFYLRVLMPLSDIPMQGSWQIALPYTILFILTVVTWGMWMSALFKTRLFATQALMFLAMPSFILSGFTWPTEAMPRVIQLLGSVLPMTYFVKSFRSIYLMDAPFEYVYRDILVLALFLLFNIAIGVLLIRRLARRGVT